MTNRNLVQSKSEVEVLGTMGMTSLFPAYQRKGNMVWNMATSEQSVMNAVRGQVKVPRFGWLRGLFPEHYSCNGDLTLFSKGSA